MNDYRPGDWLDDADAPPVETEAELRGGMMIAGCTAWLFVLMLAGAVLWFLVAVGGAW